ncbi:MAG: energy-coupling factor transporter transmembrane protein EcfT [Clostridia bacterium]|nr:energy-coupling factor transporter transmembrane protein EcfT [Clostridia bacterium]
MLKDITLGQYVSADSILHRADPRTKLLLSLLFIVTLFIANSATAFALSALVVLLAVFASSVPVRMVVRAVKPLTYIVIFTALINIFWTKGEHLLLSWQFVQIYLEGVVFAAFMALRIMLLVVGVSVILTYTTTPISLTDGLEELLMPLAKLKLPVHDFAMMMTIAMRFIPTLIEETDKIMDAQKARGADFEGGGLLAKAKALIPILVPLFVSSFKRADDLAIAMECRCYRGGAGKTKLKVLAFSAVDFWLAAFGVFYLAAVICLNLLFPLVRI